MVVTALFVIKNRVNEATWASIDTEQVGQVLCVFVQDEGRMPAGLGELRTKGYIEIRGDGRSYPGKAIIGRQTPYGGGPRDLPFMRLDDVTVKYGATYQEDSIIEGPYGFPSAEVFARKFSAIIAALLKEKLGSTTTPASVCTEAT